MADGPRVSISDVLDTHGARWSRRLIVHMPLAEEQPEARYLNGRLDIEEARSLWHDLGEALATIDEAE